MISLPVSIPLAALLPPVDPEDQEQGQDQRRDVPDGQEPEDNQPGGKCFFCLNLINSLSIFFILIKKVVSICPATCVQNELDM